MKNIIKKRLEALRKEMADEEIDIYLILTDDFHASEYVDDYFKCREYMSGFSGSAGTLLVTGSEAALWTDGRYFLQAEEELKDTGIILMKSGEKGVPAIPAYLQMKLKDGETLGFDGRCVNKTYADSLKRILKSKQIHFREDADLVGRIWTDRPKLPAHPIWELSAEYSGETREKRLERVREVMRKTGAEAHLLASLDDIAWLLNLRGNDILYNPVFLSYLVIGETDAVLYVSRGTVSEELKKKLEEENIVIRPYDAIFHDLRRLEATTLLLDPGTVNEAIFGALPEDVRVLKSSNPSEGFKAVKNETEKKNIRKAHRLDAAALIRLHMWLEEVQETEEFRQGKITELSVAEKLLELRKEQEGFLDQSFAPIIATGAHGAIVHYEPTKETDLPIQKDTFLLMDTGGQYLTGTTDITRTMVIGEVTEEMKEHYTAVLRGNLDILSAVFKKGVTGVHLDAIGRMPLWELGLDYNHGTGHGVGYLLNVHEGPQTIRPRDKAQTVGVPFEAGMLTSDEPGVYLEGEYGIRLENLVLTVPDQNTKAGEFLKFEAVTLVPFDRKAILPEHLSNKERKILNTYHRKVYETMAPLLSEKEKKWLYNATDII